MRALSIAIAKTLYEDMLRPRLFQRLSAQQAHDAVIDVLRWADSSSFVYQLSTTAQHLTVIPEITQVGSLSLESPLMLAAGFVKGDGFTTQVEALQAVHRGQNIIPGWRSVPAFVGLVEFGSYTRYPRSGNSGTVIWRNATTMSTQNRVGLKNPGAVAAAEFLGNRLDQLPQQYGLNLAVSPGITDPAQEQDEILEAADAFLSRGVRPTWFTLNLSCPNTEDDPSGNQTHEKAERLCTVLSQFIAPVPLWVKVGPGLGTAQYQGLMAAFALSGVAAVVATNTLGQPSPEGTGHMAGVGGGDLYTKALNAVQILSDEKARKSYSVAIIGCGGILTGQAKRHFQSSGAVAMQYWSALVYRGPFAAAIIQFESRETQR